MPFFKGKEDLGLQASLKLLELAPEATIEDANRAYTDLHQRIDRFHKEAGRVDNGSREEDLELLTCAYEKAIAHLADGRAFPVKGHSPARDSAMLPSTSTDLHFTINFSGDENPKPSETSGYRQPEQTESIVEDAMAITERRLRQVHEALPGAQQAVSAASSGVDAASRRHEQAKQARINALVAAKSARSRALLLEIEAKRAMDEAIAAAKKARSRVSAARDAAHQAKQESETARKEAVRIRQTEETTAAQVICAQDRLDQQKARLQALTHSLLQTRNQMNMLQGTTAKASRIREVADVSPAGPSDENPNDERKQILSDLLEIEARLQAGRPDERPLTSDDVISPNRMAPVVERRRHPRLAYPPDRCPVLSVGGCPIPVVDISSAGLRLKTADALAGQRIVRGSLSLGGGQTVAIAGKVVRSDAQCLGVKLVTRIGRRLLDQERSGLSA